MDEEITYKYILRFINRALRVFIDLGKYCGKTTSNVYWVKIDRVIQTQLMNILLLRSFTHIEYLRNNYMFRPFILGHHQDDRISYSRQLYNVILSV